MKQRNELTEIRESRIQGISGEGFSLISEGKQLRSGKDLSHPFKILSISIQSEVIREKSNYFTE